MGHGYQFAYKLHNNEKKTTKSCLSFIAEYFGKKTNFTPGAGCMKTYTLGKSNNYAVNYIFSTFYSWKQCIKPCLHEQILFDKFH